MSAVVTLLVAIAIFAFLLRWARGPDLRLPNESPAPDDAATGPPPTPDAPGEEEGAQDGPFLHPWMAWLYDAHRKFLETPRVSRPEDLLKVRPFLDLVRGMSMEPVTPAMLLYYFEGDDAVLSWAALVALARRPRDEQIEQRVFEALNRFVPWTRYFMLRLLEAWRPDDAQLATRVLVHLDDSWGRNDVVTFLDDFLRRRAEIAPLTLQGVERPERFEASNLRDTLRTVNSAFATPLLAELDESEPPEAPRFPSAPRLPSHSELGELGKVWGPGEYQAGGVIAHPSADERLDRMLEALQATPRRSVLVVGAAGAGKTALIRRTSARLSQDGWTVFEAGAGQVNAGMTYVGMLEQRVERIRRQLGRPKMVWLVPDAQQLLWAGRAVNNPVGLLELILPAIESGQMVIVGEIRPAALERLLLERPEIARMFEIVRVEPPAAAELAGLLDDWAAHAATRGVSIPREVRGEALSLAAQYLSTENPPGGVLRLLERATTLALRRAAPPAASPASDGDASVAGVAAPSPAATTLDDLVDALVQLTGLPADVLDERRPLDLDAVRQRFEGRVIGQDEAVDCLVERLALIKAGVTDPHRPYGVFLFAGGTGTGKTELARTLAEYLFGSPDRLVRIDMSELQDGRAMDRLLGTASPWETPTDSLADRVRRQPFCVVLLDEFEKAHGQVWDLFLQVFDAGRLTDHRGNTVDFRHSILILTSNLGTGGPNDVHLGMVGTTGQFSPTAVERAVARTFRPELFNRLDRLVVFRPLTREVMRRILRKELADAFGRRGLRRRDWAVEMEESAIDLLVDRGFTVAMGARPLKRALERLLLTPLAQAIVNRSAPEGDQFLFVRANADRLEVEFVDPDAPPPEIPATTMMEVAAPADLGAIVYETRGTVEEVEQLGAALAELKARVGAPEWSETKQTLLLQTASPAFWERPDRFETLGRTEYLDRIESSLRSATSLFERLRGGAGAPRAAYPRDMVRRLGQQLYLLDAASREALECGPRDAFASMTAIEGDEPQEMVDAFVLRLLAMYEGWARARGMRWRTFPPGGERDGTVLYAVSGFAAYALLAPEDGLHVMERETPRGIRRASVRIRVAPQPSTPARDAADFRRQALTALAAPVATPAVVRRYREGPAPLVRDAVRGWRTGRIERVLAGDFDVIPSGDR